MSWLARVFVLLTLVLPILALLFRIERWSIPAFDEVAGALIDTSVQAALSATAALIIGFFGALGLLALKRVPFRGTREIVELLSVLPNFVPVLFVILAALNFVKPFPFGFVGIVIAHVAVNVGLVSVVLARLIESKAGGIAELALVEGASRRQFLRRGLLPFLRGDLGLTFLYVFALCFSSFAVPLVLGGSHLKTIEVLIYEKVVINSDFGQALVLSAIQVVLLFGLAKLVSRVSSASPSRANNLSVLALPWAWAIPLSVSLLVVGVNVGGALVGFQSLQGLGITPSALISPILGTLVVALGAGVFTIFLLALVALGFPHRRFEELMNVYVVPTTAVTGFGVLLIGPMALAQQVGLLAICKIIFGTTIIYICALYRLRWASALGNLRSQVYVAETLGASEWLTFRKILWPQLLPDACFLAGIAAFWASGDFALSAIVSGEDVTLGLVAHQLLGSYRIEAASSVVLLLIVLGLFCFSVFWSLSHVYRKKSFS